MQRFADKPASCFSADFGEIPKPTVKSGWKKAAFSILTAPNAKHSGIFLPSVPFLGGIGVMSEQCRKTKFIVYTGILSALAIILYFFDFPIIPGSNYLMIDASDLPAVIAGVILGPSTAVIVELLKVLVHVLIKGMGSTMGFGDLANFIVGVAFTVPFAAVFRAAAKRGVKLFPAILLSGVTGLVSMVTAGLIGNYFIAPPYFQLFLHIKLSGAALWAAIGSATILNLIKSVLLTVVMIPIIGLLNKKAIKL